MLLQISLSRDVFLFHEGIWNPLLVISSWSARQGGRRIPELIIHARERWLVIISYLLMLLITGSIAHIASRRYLIYSEAGFEVFHPAGATRWGGLVTPTFSAPPSGETVRQTPKSFGGARTCSRSSVTMPSLVWLGFHPLLGWPKRWVFLSVCRSVWLSVTLLNVRDCAPDFTMKALEYRNDFDAVW